MSLGSNKTRSTVKENSFLLSGKTQDTWREGTTGLWKTQILGRSPLLITFCPCFFSLSNFVFSPLATHKYIFWNFVIFKCKTKSKIDEFCWLPDYTYYFDKFLCWTLSIWKWCQCQCRCLDKGVWSWNFKFPLLQPRTRTGLSSHFMRHLGPPAVADQFYLLVH